MLNSRSPYFIFATKRISDKANLFVLLTLLACGTSFHSPLVNAQQISFAKNNKSNNTEFNYNWRHHDKEYELNFAIDTATLYALPPSPANYSQRVFQEHIYVKVMRAARQIDATLANIDIRKNNSGLSFNVRSRYPDRAQKILDKLKLVHDQAKEDYWSDHFFVKYETPTGADGIRHDHAKYTSLSSASLTPVVKAIQNLQSNPSDTREFVQIALTWIQTIPYNRLEDRLSSNGAGFVSPRDLLIQNQGDCDSKSTLMAALIKAYNQNIDVQMVFLPEHALLAVNMQAMPDEMTLRYKGEQYVLLEPTGPAQIAMGDVADSTKLSLHNRQFDLSSM